MKKLLYTLLVSTVLFLASCKCTVTAPSVTQRTPDVLAKQTETVVAKETIVELPRETEVKTEETVTATLSKETEAAYKRLDTFLVEPSPVVLPAQTEVVLPKDVFLQLNKPTDVKLEPLTDVILPQGTQITITKVNWYAILFYCLLFGVASVWFIKSRQNDKNNDGFEDLSEEEKSGRKRRAKSLANVKRVN